MAELSLDHVNLVVRDLSTSILFYTSVLGLTKTHESVLEGLWMDKLVGLADVSARVAFLSLANTRLELLQYVSPEGKFVELNATANTMGLRHIAFRVVDLDSYVQKLKKNAVVFFGDPVTLSLKDIGMKREGLKKIVYFLDPDKVIVELNECLTLEGDTLCE